MIGDVLIDFDWDARIEELRGTPTEFKAAENTPLQVPFLWAAAKRRWNNLPSEVGTTWQVLRTFT